MKAKHEKEMNKKKEELERLQTRYDEKVKLVEKLQNQIEEL